MSGKPHEALVGAQFGSRADAYLASAVHAQGADLDALAALVRDRPEAMVLDLGCGGGHVSFAVAPLVRSVVACDLSPEMLAVVARTAAERGLANLRTQQGVAERLPFPDANFDCVLSRYSAHHWRDFDAGLREAARVLKPGGLLGVVDSVSPGPAHLDTWLQAVEILRDASHIRSRSRPEWEDAIIRAGLVPGLARPFRIRLVFTVWIERMQTPPVRAEAIRALQALASDGVTRHFAVEADGSFSIDVALFEAVKPL
ncbi:MAG TPA: class I SAM-dependent methyltransferase [Acetobacteraceae bacterium]|nr:class I SAM-dependent methyltransferase [Acetobacteraceae bacterium]